MNERHPLHDNANTMLEHLISGKSTSINSAAIKALGETNNTNESQIKRLKRLFERLGYKELLATAKKEGLSSVKQAKILIARAHAKGALEEAEELYNQLGLLEHGSEFSGTDTLMSDLTSIVDKFNDYNLDTVELLTQGLAYSLLGLLKASWRVGDTARDLFGNEVLSPKLTITMECDPSKPVTSRQSYTRVPGASDDGRSVRILIGDAKPIDDESLASNLRELFGPAAKATSKATA